MRKVLFITVAALALSICAFAQDFPQGPPQGGRFDPETMIQMRTQRMVRELGLNETQAAKLLELNQKYPNTFMMRPGGRPGGPGMGRPENPPQEQNVDAANADTKAAKKAAKKAKKEQKKQEEAKAADEAQAALEAYENELKEILTEEQFKTYQENKNRRPQGQGRGPGGPGGPGGFGGPGGGPGGFGGGGFGGPGGGPGGF